MTASAATKYLLSGLHSLIHETVLWTGVTILSIDKKTAQCHSYSEEPVFEHKQAGPHIKPLYSPQGLLAYTSL